MNDLLGDCWVTKMKDKDRLGEDDGFKWLDCGSKFILQGA